jgi:ubiquinone/menaquinone biosynthesis C-methylase UbiE
VADRTLLSIHHSLAEASSGEFLLDLCCGTAAVGRLFLNEGVTVVGVDISLSMLSKAEGRLSYCVNASAQALPFGDELFDVVICRQSFHLLNLKKAMREMFRVAKPGARLVVSQIVPFGEGDGDWLYRIHREKQPALKNFLYDEDIRRLLGEAGCRDIITKDYYLEESVDNWLSEPFFSSRTRDRIRELFLRAPAKYKRLHNTRVLSGQIFDTMRWYLARGIK